MTIEYSVPLQASMPQSTGGNPQITGTFIPAGQGSTAGTGSAAYVAPSQSPAVAAGAYGSGAYKPVNSGTEIVGASQPAATAQTATMPSQKMIIAAIIVAVAILVVMVG